MNRRWGGRGIPDEALPFLKAVAAALQATSAAASLSGETRRRDPVTGGHP